MKRQSERRLSFEDEISSKIRLSATANFSAESGIGNYRKVIK